MSSDGSPPVASGWAKHAVLFAGPSPWEAALGLTARWVRRAGRRPRRGHGENLVRKRCAGLHRSRTLERSFGENEKAGPPLGLHRS